MFRSEASELVKGSMLALTIDAMLDFAGDRTGHFRMIECEVSSHNAYGTPRKLFGEFFGVIADTLRDILGGDWSPEIEKAWRRLLAEIDQVVAECEVQNEPHTLPSSWGARSCEPGRGWLPPGGAADPSSPAQARRRLRMTTEIVSLPL